MFTRPSRLRNPPEWELEPDLPRTMAVAATSLLGRLGLASPRDGELGQGGDSRAQWPNNDGWWWRSDAVRSTSGDSRPEARAAKLIAALAARLLAGRSATFWHFSQDC